MTNPTRPGPPHTAPRGHLWVPDVVPHADPIEVITGGGGRKCASRRNVNPYRHNPCNATAVAMVNRVFLCDNHLGEAGMWVDAGVVLRWVLEPIGEEEGA